MKNQELSRLLSLEEWNASDERIALNLEDKDREFLAEHIQTYDGILIDLSYDKSMSVREAVASNKHTPINILTRLSTSDESPTVRSKATSTMKELER